MKTMKTLTITKNEVIDAILTEPLKSGDFFHDVSMDDGKCNVCAVGSILRRISKKNNEKVAFDYEDAADLTKGVYGTADYTSRQWDGFNFLSKLSCAYEAFCDQYNYKGDEDEVREFLLHVIEAYCPKKIKIQKHNYLGFYEWVVV